MSERLDQIEQLLAKAERDASGLPPVQLWQPELSGDIDIRILADGRWQHEGSEFKRLALVKLFSSILRREGDDYFLVTPVEKWRIQVEDAPFFAGAVSVLHTKGQEVLAFTLNTGDTLIADAQHPVEVEQGARGPRPYLQVRDGLRALIGRSAFYELVEQAQADDTDNCLYVSSRGARFTLGSL